MKIKDARAVVTGGASGLGNAVARHLSAHGGKVVILDVQEGPGRAAAAALGGAARFLRCDVTSEAEVNAAMDAAHGHLGGLNLLVNCAGVVGAGPPARQERPDGGRVLHQGDPHQPDRHLPVRQGGRGPHAEQRAGRGRRARAAIHTSSVAAFEGQIGQAAYSATKAAVAGMTLPIARELARFGIRCVSIAPGIFHTPMMDGMPQEVQDSLAAQVPFPARLGRPEEFAQLVAAVCEIPMLNGETIRLDGAIRMQPK